MRTKTCSVCGGEGHNARRHYAPARRRAVARANVVGARKRFRTDELEAAALPVLRALHSTRTDSSRKGLAREARVILADMGVDVRVGWLLRRLDRLDAESLRGGDAR